MSDNFKEFERFLIDSMKHESTAKNYLKDFYEFVELLKSDYTVNVSNLTAEKIKSIGESVLSTPKYIEHEKATRGRMRAAINNYLKFINANARIKGGYSPDFNEEKKAMYSLDKKIKHTIDTKELALNLILYGPPGTGKTYNTINKALEIINGEVPEPREKAQQRFNILKEDGQIEFITFHQSYSYEDFVEGIKPDIDCESLKFVKKDGIFKKICEKAKAKRTLSYDFDENKIKFHKMSLGDTLADEDDIYEYCMKEGFISTGYGGDIDYSYVKDDEDIRRVYFEKYPNWTSFGATAITRFKNKILKGDIVVISKGNRSIRAIGKVVGDYIYNQESPIDFNHFREVEWLYKDGEISVKKILKDKWLSQQSIYTFDNSDININGLKELLTGEEKSKNYVLIIDEINRGNISRIFGELITLIEEDKRDGNMTVKLPYSQTDFTVPSNLYIIGTMNTADRSIALLDIALRRRFSFLRFDPDSSLVVFKKAQEIMEKLNEEIMKSKGNDFLIGHSYFMKVSDSEDLKTVLEYKVKPLLEEYFVNDSGKLKEVLAIVDQGINNA